jgi:hypothetical protein
MYYIGFERPSERQCAPNPADRGSREATRQDRYTGRLELIRDHTQARKAEHPAIVTARARIRNQARHAALCPARL